MKQLLLTAIIAASIIACKKEKKSCYKCITTVTYSPSSAGGTGTSTTAFCGMTEDDKKNYEKAGTHTTTSTSGGYTVTVISNTRCTRQ